MKQRKSFKTKVIVGIVCVVPLLMLLSGCAAKKAYKKPAVQTHRKVILKPRDVIEIQYVRTNVQTHAYEVLTLTRTQARIERPGRKKPFEPKSSSFSKDRLLELAKKAVTFSWNINPVRVRNRLLKEELVLKTQNKEERVMFEENMSSEFKILYAEVIAIRQKVLKTGK